MRTPETSFRFPITFSQGSLQDFVDCPRRFQLRYLLNLAWPAIESEPILEQERRMRLGAQFHRLIQQYFIGIHPNQLTSFIHDPELEGWWQAFIGFVEGYSGNGLLEKSDVRIPEASLSTSLVNTRLLAQYDLIAIGNTGKIKIYDWKTSQKRPKRAWLAARLQTRVYFFLMANAGAYLKPGHDLAPEQVEMIYWFSNFPDEPEIFEYSAEQYQADANYLSSLIGAIKSLDADQFQLTDDPDRCRFCVYRSLCSRGVEAGSFDASSGDLEPSAPQDFDFDYSQISEIEF